MRLPKILHTADLHINSLRKFPDYLARMEETLNRISAVAVKESCDLIVVAGDVWTAKSITHEERQLFSSWLGSSLLPMVVISGNHDKRSSQTEIGDTSLSYLSTLGSAINKNFPKKYHNLLLENL